MKFKYVVWKINKLFKHYNNDELNLSPPYQRNEVWTKKAQRELIDTIVRNQPIPSFFVYQRDTKKYEMVDGQQRSRSILAFLNNIDKSFTTSSGKSLADYPEFINYPLNITLITEVNVDENIEEFYALVNRTGLRLNKPELFKAQYYDTNFLALVTEIINDEEFKKLALFRSVSRMNDYDLVTELLALLKFGIYDKKEKVEDMYESDISKKERESLKEKFLKIIAVMNSWSNIMPVNKTRYKQKNDLYTLFSLIHENINKDKILINMYKWLLAIENDIYPSQDKCEPFKNYALHCVTQSNSKAARTERLKILKEVIFPDLNTVTTDNIKRFYDFEDDDFVKIDGLTMYNPDLLTIS